MAIAIDRAAYIVAPRISVGSGSTLIEQLVHVAKDDESEIVGASLKKLRKVLAGARATSVESVRTSATTSAAGDLEVDRGTDRIIKAIKLRLEAWPLIGEGDQARRAQELLALLYPGGLRFTQAAFAVQHAEMRRMLTEMKDPDVAASLDELVGPEFIKAFKKAAKVYGEMVKAMGSAVGSDVDRRTVVIGMQTAIVQHASRVLGELDDDDPASVERARRLLAPIDNFRARASAGGGSGGASDEDAGEDEDGSAGSEAPPVGADAS